MDRMNINTIRKIKNERKKLGGSAEQIVSPLAKYDSKGNLFCIICKNLIKSAAIWKVHINSKLHRSNIEEAKKLSKKDLEKTLQPQKIRETETLTKAFNSKKVTTNEAKKPLTADKELTQKHSINATAVPPVSSDLLPEMFFDDPVVDAKIRNVEYKSVQDDEWEKFQREIKEESMASNKLIFGEQINSAVEREITEISEQIYQWSKVIDLENKLQKIIKVEKRSNELEESDEDVSNDEFIDENLDWRSKKIS